MKILTRTLVLLSVVLCFVFFIVVVLHQNLSVIKLHHDLLSHAFLFSLCRYSSIVLLIIFWPRLIRVLGKWRNWDENLMAMLVKKQGWVLGFFIAMEILFFWSSR